MADETILILQGGGALGAYEAGVYKALEERGLVPDVVVGVSIGAINGALIASQPKGKAAPVLEQFWHAVATPTPYAPHPALRRLTSAWQALWWGVPGFFRPRWTLPWLTPPVHWTSVYDSSPMRATLRRFVDMAQVGSNGIRLMVAAVNVETGELEMFDSAMRDLGLEHIVASASLPPGLPWTRINGKAYWDGALVSNTPLRPALERLVTECVLDGRPVAKKRIVIVELFPKKSRLPRTMLDVLERQKEILYSDKTEADIRACELLNDAHLLIRELMGHVAEATAAQIIRGPLYQRIECSSCLVEVTRITHQDEADEFESKDYDFSREAIEHHLTLGHRHASEALT